MLGSFNMHKYISLGSFSVNSVFNKSNSTLMLLKSLGTQKSSIFVEKRANFQTGFPKNSPNLPLVR